MGREARLVACARNCGDAYVALAAAMGRPSHRWDDVWAGDFRLARPEAPNNATLLRPMDGPAFEDALERIRGFFTGPGGGFQIWSLWTTPDLSDRGFELFHSPAMILPSDAEPGPAPAELRIAEVDDGAGVAAVEALWIESFELVGSTPDAIVDERALAAWRLWLGSVDDRPVAVSAAHASDGHVGIYGVVTAPDVRGRGYGEAMTWAAATSEPGMPAALQASALGRPVYERMGFRTLADFTVWETAER